ncbi:TetR/AcrR family transcriptional regulator [Gordonia sp. SID5947]|uniref:TetR/AcrR family transcriptional regulator n=1 Tax=Gordonia sp. SID5947 TaxID=2690315 RepID=UPI001F2846B0|nr:TetR/AcrR family transcriptional regulator [Gordonia sp. SID5947]
MDMVNGSQVARRIAARSIAKRESDYADEVGRLIDAGRQVMARSGSASRPRVADIVGAAGLSNDAFYRHFRSKDDLIAAILEDGTDRLCSYLGHQMGKAQEPRERVVRWVEGVLSQAQTDSAQTTRAVLWNVGSVNQEVMSSPPSVNARLAELLHEPLRELGSGDHVFDARLISNATVGALSDYLWRKESPTARDISRIVAACLRLVD